MALSRRNSMALLGVDVLLLVLAQAAFNGDSTVDNVVWSIAWLGLLLLIVFGVAALVRSRRRSTA